MGSKQKYSLYVSYSLITKLRILNIPLDFRFIHGLNWNTNFYRILLKNTHLIQLMLFKRQKDTFWSTWTFDCLPNYLTWTNVDIWLTTYLPYLVHVVCERPLSQCVLWSQMSGANKSQAKKSWAIMCKVQNVMSPIVLSQSVAQSITSGTKRLWPKCNPGQSEI